MGKLVRYGLIKLHETTYDISKFKKFPYALCFMLSVRTFV